MISEYMNLKVNVGKTMVIAFDKGNAVEDSVFTVREKVN